jgi:2-polyprenyl-3-methyl-5-hydroxy-6-metoxy-1,4-benzoquinol methylase
VAPGGRVLDVGCGAGLLLHWLSARTAIEPFGIDASEGQVALARRNAPRASVEHGEALPYLSAHRERFDGIFCMDVLEHVSQADLLEWVIGLRAALVPGGFLVCKVPNAANLTGGQLRYIDLTHERSFTRLSLYQLLEAADLTDCRVLPVRAAHLSGRARLLLERLLHRVVYRVCGDAGEVVFTRTLTVVALKK